jgi:hypothetical protein
VSHFPPSDPDPEAFRPASADDATGPIPEADEPTLVTGEPVLAADEPTQENAVVHVGEEPVFVDTSGRRRTILRRVGIGIGTLAVAYLALFVVSLAGGPRPPGIPLPEAVAGEPDRTQTEPDGSVPGTPATGPSEPTPGGSPASTAGAGSGAPATTPADPVPSAVPPGAAVPPAPAPPPAPPTATPVPTTTPAPTTPAPTTPASPTPAPALPSPLVTVPAPAADLTEPSEP